jgi:NAD(P)-binding Rossmann-like domain
MSKNTFEIVSRLAFGIYDFADRTDRHGVTCAAKSPRQPLSDGRGGHMTTAKNPPKKRSSAAAKSPDRPPPPSENGRALSVMTNKGARELLWHYRLGQSSVFIIGAFDKGITIFSQQVRALNLAWALIEGDEIYLDTDSSTGDLDESRKQIAIVGAGFAGLTAAAGLLKKRVNADITIFEQRDTVLPLQQGCDTRWLHPHIYDWPNSGSEASSAALPVLNWTANRASDVVGQILKEWHDIVEDPAPQPRGTTSRAPKITMYCNSRYIRVAETDDSTNSTKLTIEWLAEARSPHNPAVPADEQPAQTGSDQRFDIVILAIGFGLETLTRNSYWRNETLAQPHLGQARRTYIVSGAGDGALIDLCRLCVANFRQDRILAELFADRPALVARLRSINHSRTDGLRGIITLWQDPTLGADKAEVLDRLRRRLRQDTTVLLRALETRFSRLCDNKPVSFQNRLLAYLLYRCGAFTLVCGKVDNSDIDQLCQEHGVPAERVIIRHGTQKKEGFDNLLPANLSDEVGEYIKSPSRRHEQQDVPAWLGGYFNMPGIRQTRDSRYEPSKEMLSSWRREYLPSPTEAVAVAFCSAVAGFLTAAMQPRPSSRLRVTLHRRLVSGDEIVLQQCCAYQGIHVDQPEHADPGAAGRVFSSITGTIGTAFTLGRVVHTRSGATKEALRKDMNTTNLNDLAREMSREVASLASIPLLVDAAKTPTDKPLVIAVLYVDSYDADAFIGETLNRLVAMCRKFLESLPEVAHTAAGSIANTDFWKHSELHQIAPTDVNKQPWKALQIADIEAPRTARPRYLNFDFSEFTPVEELNVAVEDSTDDGNRHSAGNNGADARPAPSRPQTLT